MPRPPSYTSYTVKTGDTLSKIAARFGTTVSTLTKANGLSDANKIRVGQILSVPASVSVLEELTPSVKRLPVVIDNATGQTAAPEPDAIPEVIVTAARPVPGFDWEAWLRPPKVYVTVALILGAALLFSQSEGRHYD